MDEESARVFGMGRWWKRGGTETEGGSGKGLLAE